MIINIDDIGDKITGFSYTENIMGGCVNINIKPYNQISITDASKSRTIFIYTESISKLIKCLELAAKEFGENNV